MKKQYTMKTTTFFRMGVIISLCLFVGLPALQAQTQPFLGLGTQSFPYTIETAAELASMAQLVNDGDREYNDKYYRLENNISLTSYGSSFNGGKGWIPIGTDDHPFMGSFDGNNKTITNLYINNPQADSNSSLFGRLHGGKVKNLNVSGNVTGGGNTGGIAGYVTYNSAAGSVGEISHSLFQGTVAGSGENVGGVAGRILSGRLVNCYATGTVQGKNNVGGVAGATFGGSITNCAALNESVKATDAGANIGRVAWAQTGMGASALSGNFAFYEMTVTSNNVPKTISNNANGMDGASKTALELQAIGGYPAGFNSSPWVFTPGRLPGLGTTVVKPQYLAAIRINLIVQRNGIAWNSHGKTYTIRNGTTTQVLSGTGSSLTAIVKQSGVWKVYDGDTDTGATITANEVSGEGTINYFTISFTVVNSGAASGSTISATYNNSSITSGATVLGGKQLVITAKGAGASTYLYSWSGAGTSNQTTSSITLNLIASRIDAQCVVTSSHAVTFGTVNGNGTLTATVDGNAISSGALIQYGKSVVFTAKPNPNYRIKEWKNNGAVVNGVNTTYTAYNITEARNITVEYEFITHLVTFSAGTNGSLIASVGGTSIPSGVLVQQGKDVVFTASPQYGYRVKEWRVNGTPVSGNTSNSYTLYSLNAATVVTVEFEITPYTVTFSVVNGNGTLTVKVNDGAAISTSPTTVLHGSKVEFTATPNANYRVKAWRVNNVTTNGTNTAYTITELAAAQTVTVEFELVTYTVTFSVKGANGTIKAVANGSSITSGAQVQHGKTVVFTASPNTGYRVKEWKNGENTVNGTDVTYTVSDLSAALNVTVEYEQASYPVTFSVLTGNGNIAATVDGSGITTGATVLHGKSIAFTSSPDVGYRVKAWRVNGAQVSTSVNYTLPSLVGPTDVTVEFEIVTYTVTFSVMGSNGTLTAMADGSAISSGATVKHGTTVIFTATPAANYRVKGWKDNNTTVNGTNTGYTMTNLAAAHTVTVEFEPITYAVTFSVSGSNGTLAARVDGSVIANGALIQQSKTVEFTATPSANYRVKEWKNGSETVNGTNTIYTVTNLSAPITVTVEFEAITHAVTFSVTGGNGTLAATVDQSGISSGAQVLQGKNVVFSASPATGYRVKEWKLNGTTVSGNTTINYTLTNLPAPSTITVEFEPVTYAITFNVSAGSGTLTATVDGAAITSGAQVQYGKTVNFTATPAANNRVKGWKDNSTTVNGTNATYSVSGLAAAHTVTVEFEPVTYAITFSVAGSNGTLAATVDGAAITSVAQVQYGKAVVFTANPSSGYRVKEWTDNGATVNGTNTSYTLNGLAAAHTVTVEFEQITHAVTFSVVNGNGTLAATVDQSGISSGAQVLQGKNVVFSASPATGYRVKEWKLNGTAVSGNTTINYTLQNLPAPSTVTVEFEPVTYAITFNVSAGSGTLTATVDGAAITSGAQVQYGKTVNFTATPAANNRVKGWKDNSATVNGTNATYSVSGLAAAHTVTVEFEPVTYAITFNVAGSNGTLAATVDGAAITSVAQVQYGKAVVFTATPANGYRVKEWTDNGATVNGTNTGYTLNSLAAAHTVTVEYERITYAVTFSVVNGNGALAARVDNVSIASGALIQNGKNVEFTATPATGYRVKEWKLNNGVISGNTSNSYTLSNLTALASVTVEFEPDTYAVTFNVTGGISGTLSARVDGTNISSGNTVLRGKSVVFTATPPNNCTRVKEWKLNGTVVSGSTSNYTLANLNATSAVTVEFETVPCSVVTFNVINGNGTLTATIDGNGVTSGESVLNGKNIVFTATPNSGYRVKEWKFNTSTVSGNTSNTYTLSNLANNATVTVEFELLPAKEYLVSFSVVNSNGGTLTATVDGNPITSGASVVEGKNIVFTANPADGHQIKEWKDNGSTVNGTNQGFTINSLSASRNVTVEFVMKTYAISFNTVNTNGTLLAEVEGTGIATGATVDHGKSVVLTAYPNEGYCVKEWKLGGVAVSGNTTNRYTLTVTSSTTVTVEFIPVTYPITFNVVNGNGTLAATIDGSSVNTGGQVQHGRAVVFTATPNTGYRVKEWKDNGDVVNATNGAYTINSFTVSHTVTVEFEPITYRITFNIVNSYGALTATVDGGSILSGAMIQHGKNVVFTAAPTTGYRVKAWKDNGNTVNGTNATYTLTGLTTAHDVTVEFEIITHSVTFSVTGGNGTLAATVDGSGISSGASVQQSKDVVFMASPANGYSVKEWRLNGTVVSGYTSNSYTLTNLSTTANVTVTFELTTLLLTYSVDGVGGTLAATAGGAPIASNNLVDYGKTVVLTAAPTSGYRVKGWTDNGATVNGANATYTINNFTVAHYVVVTFERIPYQITFNTVDSYGALTATVDGENIVSGAMVPNGRTVAFTATPNTGYRVKEWEDNGNTVNGTNATYTLTGLSAVHDVTVEFEIITHPVTFSVTGGNGTLAATVDGSGISSGASVQQSKDVVFMASPANGYSVKEWRLNGTVVSGYTSNSYTLTNLSTTANVTVTFELTTLLLTYSVDGAGGTLSATAGGVTIASNNLVDYDKTVVLTAAPASGYRVKGWTDNGATVNGANATYTINNFTVAHHVVVTFERIPYQITFNTVNSYGALTATVDGGSIVSGAMVPNGKSVIFTATPTAGYRVKEWKDNGNTVNGTNATYTLTGLLAAHDVTVEFEIITHPVTFSVTGGNGALAATVDGLGVSSGVSVQQGRSIVFMASPANGYSVKEWRLNGTVISGYTSNTYTLTNLSETANVTVTFEQTTLLLKYSIIGGNGTLDATVDGVNITSNNLVEYGKSVVFNAIPGDYQKVKEWTDNGETVNGDYATYTIDNFAAAHTVTVEFELIPYPVIFYTVNNNGTLTATVGGTPIESGNLAPHGSNIVFTAEPKPGFRIIEWKDNGNTVNGTDATYTVKNLTSAHIVTVEYELITYPVKFGVAGSNGSLAATVDDVSIKSNARVQKGRDIVFLASPLSGYCVEEWKLNGTVIPGYTSDRYLLTNLTEDVEITVAFEPVILMLNFGVEGGNGSLTATVGGADFETGNLVDYGKSVVLTATPIDGYRIKEWKDNGETVNGANAKYTIPNFTSRHTVTVSFEPVTYPVAFEVVNGNGTIGAKVDGVVITSVAQVQQGKSVIFTAIPNSGYRVKEWNLNGTVVTENKTNSFELTNLTEPATVAVEFESESYTLTFMVVNGNGTITAMVGGIVSIASGATVPYGSSITFTADPDYSYHVKEWKLNNMVVPNNATNTYTLILTNTTTVTVEFAMSLLITTNGLPNGAVGMMYSQTLSTTSDESVTWSITNGSLPDGLSLFNNGGISGIPTKAGTFTFTVKAENNTGIGAKEFTITIEKGAGEKVNVPTVKSQTLTSITVNVVPSPGNGQAVEYAIGTTSNANATSLTWKNELIFSGLKEYSTYYLYARSKENDDYFSGAPSVSEAITTNTVTGSEEIGQAPAARIYPNPTTGAFTLEFDVADTYHITITDINGKILVRQTVADQINRMNIRDAAAGVYLLIIDDGKKQTVMRIVKE